MSNVEIKHVDLDETMVRAIAKQAEAERMRRAKVIAADGEFQASEKLKDAAKVLSEERAALTLRYLQTLLDMSTEKTSTVLFPIPIDLMAAFKEKITHGKGAD